MRKQLVLAAVGALMLASAPIVMAETVREETTTEKTTSYKGTVSEIVPGSSTIVFKSEAAPSPQRYQFSEKTTFVDANGNVVSRETIQNQPVTIYTSPSDPMMVSKVIVTRPGGVTTKEKTVEEREVR